MMDLFFLIHMIDGMQQQMVSLGDFFWVSRQSKRQKIWLQVLKTINKTKTNSPPKKQTQATKYNIDSRFHNCFLFYDKSGASFFKQFLVPVESPRNSGKQYSPCRRETTNSKNIWASIQNKSSNNKLDQHKKWGMQPQKNERGCNLNPTHSQNKIIQQQPPQKQFEFQNITQ